MWSIYRAIKQSVKGGTLLLAFYWEIPSTGLEEGKLCGNNCEDNPVLGGWVGAVCTYSTVTTCVCACVCVCARTGKQMFVLWVECTSTYNFCRFVLVSMHARVCVSVYVHVSAQLWHAKEGQGPRDKRGRLPAWLPWQRRDGKGSVGIAIKMESGAPLHAYTHTHTQFIHMKTKQA